MKIHNVLLGLALFPAAAFLMKKHAVTKTDGKEEHLYTLKGGSWVAVTNQTPSKTVKNAVRICFKK